MAARDIRIFNFSNSDKCQKDGDFFRFTNAPFCYFLVEVHPRGMRNKEYVSVRILKLAKDATAWSYVSNFHLSWTLSVVDLNGDTRFSRSFVIANAVQFTNEDILDFQKRSHLLSLADELLQEDVLTIRCELHEIFIGADELLVPKTKEERPSDSMNQFGIMDTDTARKRGEVRIVSEMHKIYSSILSLSQELSYFRGELREEEEIRNMLASYDALGEIWQTYLGSELTFRAHLLLKEKLRKVINGENDFICNVLRNISLESNSNGERQKITQLTPEHPKDEGKWFFETIRHEDGESDGTIETYIFNFEKKMKIELKNFLVNISKLLPFSLDFIFDKNAANGEQDSKRETVRQDCSLSQKDEEGERVTENVQPLDFDISYFRDNLKEGFKDGFGIIQHFMEEKNFDTRHGNAYEEQGCKREATTEMNSGPSHGEFQFLPGTVGQEGSLSRQDGESERRTEIHRPSDLGINNILIKMVDMVQQFLIEEELTSETQYEKTECGRKKITPITSRPAKDKFNNPLKCALQLLVDSVKGQNTCPVSESSLNSPYGGCQRSMQRGQPSDLTMNMSSEDVEEAMEEYFKPMVKLFQNYHRFIEHASTAENQATWNLYLETMDGTTFTIPFEDGRETLGSKLVSRSKVFQRTVELNPKRETPEEKVKLKDDDSDTFINFLSFLQTEDIEVETFPELISLYIFADKYDVEELMVLCAERMQPFFSPSNIDEVEEFACMHYDEHLLELVQLYKEKNIQPVSKQNEDTETLLNENSAALNEKRNESHRDFDFYM